MGGCQWTEAGDEDSHTQFLLTGLALPNYPLNQHNRRNYFVLLLQDMTQFQIKDGGLVQGVTKFITTLSTLMTPKKNDGNCDDTKGS